MTISLLQTTIINLGNKYNLKRFFFYGLHSFFYTPRILPAFFFRLTTLTAPNEVS